MPVTVTWELDAASDRLFIEDVIGPLQDPVTWYGINYTQDANNVVGLPKQRNSYQSSPTFLCFWSPTESFASHCNLFRTMWPYPAKGLLSEYFLVRTKITTVPFLTHVKFIENFVFWKLLHQTLRFLLKHLDGRLTPTSSFLNQLTVLIKFSPWQR